MPLFLYMQIAGFLITQLNRYNKALLTEHCFFNKSFEQAYLKHTKSTKLWTQTFVVHNISRVIKQPAFCRCENKDAVQLHGNPVADFH